MSLFQPLSVAPLIYLGCYVWLCRRP